MQSSQSAMRLLPGVLCTLMVLSGCTATAPEKPAAVTPPLSTAAVTALRDEAKRVMPTVKTPAAREFLRATEMLTPRASRDVYVRESGRERTFATPARFEELKAEDQAGYQKQSYEDAFYFSTYYGSPLAYARALDLAGTGGITTLNGARVLDIGYGAIGAPKLMALAGARVSAVDVDPLLPVLYREPTDQGTLLGFEGRSGSLRLFDGVFAGSTTLTKLIGGGYQLILTKNTMKNGFMKPRSGRKPFVDFQASDEVLLEALNEALEPRGVLVIYNISNKFDPARPATDGRSPFSREQFEKANFEVLSLDTNDDIGIRALARALQWDRQVTDGLESFFALYTIVRKK